MTETYLLPARRQLEHQMALVSFGFGFWIAFWHMTGSYHPIGWTGLTGAGHLLVAWSFMGGAVVHGIGVKLNGGHRWSPMWRAVGLCVIFLAFCFLASRAPDLRSSAVYMYGLAGWLYLRALRSALTDCFRAIQNPEGRAWMV